MLRTNQKAGSERAIILGRESPSLHLYFSLLWIQNANSVCTSYSFKWIFVQLFICTIAPLFSYSRNIMHLHCPLLMRGIPYYELEWQMDFPNAEDTYYLAHCYPYTFTDLKEDLDAMLNNPERRQWIKREVLCETRAGNSCFLVTCTNFGKYCNITDFDSVEL